MLSRFSRDIITSQKPSTHLFRRTFQSSAINMGVTKKVLTPGNGTDKPKAGDNVAMIYTGWLEDTSKSDSKGKQFDSSVGRGDGTFPVKIGTGQVIKGNSPFFYFPYFH
jgi:FKBP-type peptidyl-prolyl cis-trans isomerase